MSQADKIIDFITSEVAKHPSDLVDFTATHFNVTRTTVHRHLKKLIKKGSIVKTGTTKDTQYFRADSLNIRGSCKIQKGLDEFDIFSTYLEKALSHFPDNIQDVLAYGFTEVFNNAIDHSKGTKVWFESTLENTEICIAICDDGVGVFKTIFDYFDLDDMRESVLQLNKGKMTTDPTNHTGEGLFFCARSFDVFEIFANNVHYIRDNREDDWALESYDKSNFGSKVVMRVAQDSRVDLTKVFTHYQDPEGFGFDRTDILVELSRFGQEKLISRSQAKRILRGIESRFKMITLDFKGIRLVGQGFVDEIFRVFQNQHPDIEFKTINTNDDVEFMLKRSRPDLRN